tara:strand:- start:332 stop:613 length:282 start_codon:yes stop_codon:yes gene_type:complete
MRAEQNEPPETKKIMQIKFNKFNADDSATELNVEFTVSGGFRQTYWEPEESPEIEVQSITDEDGGEVELTDEESAELEEAIWASDLSDEDPRY